MNLIELLEYVRFAFDVSKKFYIKKTSIFSSVFLTHSGSNLFILFFFFY